MFECLLDFIAVGEVSKVIYVDAKVKGRLSLDKALGEDARVVPARGQANLDEGGNEELLPVFGALAEAK